MTKQKMLELTQKQEEFYNKRDLANFCACFHDEVIVQRLTTGEGFSGIHTFREKYQKLFLEKPNIHCEIRSRIVLSSSVVDEEYISMNDGVSEPVHAVAVYAFRDNLIDRVWLTR